MIMAPNSHQTIPFSKNVLEEELPKYFHLPQLDEYSGISDPEDHLCRFKSFSLLYRYTDGVKCRVFLTTLAGSALRWFNKLPSGSISCFEDLSSAFLRYFASCKRYVKTPMDLCFMKQKSQESLREYIQRFNQVALEVPSASSELLMNSFAQGLLDGQFFNSLIKKFPLNFVDLLRRAEKYVNLEEAQKARREDVMKKSTIPRIDASCKRYAKTPMILFFMKQKNQESLREYIQRFNQVALEVPSASSELLIISFSLGLLDGQFFNSLIKNPPLNFDDLLRRAERYVNLEEVLKARREDAMKKSTLPRIDASCKRYAKTPMNLFFIKQKNQESLQEYIQRFNRVALEVPSASSELLIDSFSQGLLDGQFFNSLIKKTPFNFDDLLRRAEKYVNLEEVLKARREMQ